MLLAPRADSMPFAASEASRDATENSPRTTNEGEAEMSGSPHWTISATGSFERRPKAATLRHYYASSRTASLGKATAIFSRCSSGAIVAETQMRVRPVTETLLGSKRDDGINS
jgi:hypothetical protein